MENLPQPEQQPITKADRHMFASLLTPPRNRMPLTVFERDFLPFLSSKPVPEEVIAAILEKMKATTGLDHDREDIASNFINRWVSYFDSINAPSCMVDVMQGEQVVYTVPPILDPTHQILEDNVDTRSLVGMIEHATNLATVHFLSSEKYMVENVVPLIRKGSPNMEYIKMWNVIYAYHDLPLITIVDDRIQVTGEAPVERKVVDGATVESDGAVSYVDEY